MKLLILTLLSVLAIANGGVLRNKRQLPYNQGPSGAPVPAMPPVSAGVPAVGPGLLTPGLGGPGLGFGFAPILGLGGGLGGLGGFGFGGLGGLMPGLLGPYGTIFDGPFAQPFGSTHFGPFRNPLAFPVLPPIL